MKENQLFNENIYTKLSLTRREGIDQAIIMILNDSRLRKSMRKGKKRFILYEKPNERERKEYNELPGPLPSETYQLILDGEGLKRKYVNKHIESDFETEVSVYQTIYTSPIRLCKGESMPCVDFSKTKISTNNSGDVFHPQNIKELQKEYKSKGKKDVCFYFPEDMSGHQILKALEDVIKRELKIE